MKVMDSNSGNDRVRLIVVIAAIVVLYLPTRLFLLLCMHPQGSDVELYARYAYIHLLAAEKGVPFHKMYKSMGLADVHDKKVLWFDSTVLTIVCYPPLAVAFTSVPSLLINTGRPVSLMSLDGFTARYQPIYRWLCALLETITVVTMSMLILVLYKNEGALKTLFRMAVLCITGVCLPYIIYDRLDIVMSALLAVSLALLLEKRPFVSFVIFASAVAFKIIPLFLLPVWVLGSFKQSDFQQETFKERVTSLFKISVARGTLIGCMVAGIFLLFYSIEGKGSLDFIGFQSNRGIHLESVWGALSLFAARISGASFRIINNYGSSDVVMPAAHVLTVIAMPVLCCLMLGLTTLLAIRCVKKLAVKSPEDTPLLHATSVIETALLFLCVVFSVSRIFSPQYLLLLVPIAALMPLTGRGEAVFAALLALCCCFSTLIYPYFFEFAIVKGPTLFGLFLLSTRSLLLLCMAGFLFARAIATVKNDQLARHDD
jgi:hypothetical protein